MTSYTTSARFTLQVTGTNNNTWGNILNTGVFALVDDNINGIVTFMLSGAKTLTSVNGATDEARCAILNITGGAGGTITIPPVSKNYRIRNGSSGAVIVTTGGITNATLQAGEVADVMCDGSAVRRVFASDFGGLILTSVGTPVNRTDGANKAYVDDTAFNMAAGALPAQPGNAGKFVRTDGSLASWQYVLSTDVVGLSASASVVRTGTSTTAALTPGDTYNALAEVTLTDAATIAVDMSTFLNGVVTLGGNRTLGNPSNVKPGQGGRIRLIQDATGSRTLTVASNWKRAGGALALTTTANAIDVLVYDVVSSSYILYDIIRNPT